MPDILSTVPTADDRGTTVAAETTGCGTATDTANEVSKDATEDGSNDAANVHYNDAPSSAPGRDIPSLRYLDCRPVLLTSPLSRSLSDCISARSAYAVRRMSTDDVALQVTSLSAGRDASEPVNTSLPLVGTEQEQSDVIDDEDDDSWSYEDSDSDAWSNLYEEWDSEPDEAGGGRRKSCARAHDASRRRSSAVSHRRRRRSSVAVDSFMFRKPVGIGSLHKRGGVSGGKHKRPVALTALFPSTWGPGAFVEASRTSRQSTAANSECCSQTIDAPSDDVADIEMDAAISPTTVSAVTESSLLPADRPGRANGPDVTIQEICTQTDTFEAEAETMNPAERTSSNSGPLTDDDRVEIIGLHASTSEYVENYLNSLTETDLRAQSSQRCGISTQSTAASNWLWEPPTGDNRNQTFVGERQSVTRQSERRIVTNPFLDGYVESDSTRDTFHLANAMELSTNPFIDAPQIATKTPSPALSTPRSDGDNARLATVRLLHRRHFVNHLEYHSDKAKAWKSAMVALSVAKFVSRARDTGNGANDDDDGDNDVEFGVTGIDDTFE